MLFLHYLNGVILGLVLTIVILALIAYIATTAMPLFMAFCPYDTPLSSRRLWALFYRHFVSDEGDKPTQVAPPLKCQQKERKKSENTVPDELTARALEWLIGHSKEEETVDIAIRALSSTILKAQIHKYLARNSLITLLAQIFTAIFNGVLEGENYNPNGVVVNGSQLEKAARYGRALINITRHIKIQSVSHSDIHDQGSRIALMEDQVIAVERGIFLVSSSSDVPAIIGSGVTCLSAWYESTGRAAQSRDKWKKMLAQLIELLSNNNRHERLRSKFMAQSSTSEMPMRDSSAQVEGDESAAREDCHASTKAMESDALDRIVHALLLELAHWRWDLNKQERLDILIPLIKLFIPPLDLLNGPCRPGMSAILAILAILFHDYQESSNGRLFQTDHIDSWVYVPDPGPKGDQLHLVHEEVGPKDIQQPTAPRSKSRSELVQRAICAFQGDDKYMPKHADALLFIGLAGLLDSLSVLGLAKFASEVVELVTTQLNAMSGTFHSGPILLPNILPRTSDIWVFMADAITQSLSPSPLKGQSLFSEKQKADLLECLWDKSYLWLDYGQQFLMPIVQLLHIAQTIELRGQCLTALNEYCFTNSNPIQHSSPYHGADWRFFFSLDVPYRLAEIMKENEALSPKAAATFDSIMQTTLKDLSHSKTDVKDRISATISRLAISDLLSTFAEAALCRHSYSHIQMWRDQLIALPEWLDIKGAQNAELVKTKLCQFYTENIRKSVPMTRLALGVGRKLELDKGCS